MNMTRRGAGWTKQWTIGFAAAGVMLACAGAVTAQTDAGGTTTAVKTQDLSKLEKRDLIIFRTGNKVEGVILEETETTVRFLVIVGTLRTPVSYTKSEILEIKRNEFKPSAAAKDESKEDKKDEKKDAPKLDAPEGAIVDLKGNVIPDGTLKVFVTKFGGEFGRDVSKTPVKKMMDEVARAQPDVLIVRFDHEFKAFGEEAGANFYHVGWQNLTYAQLDKARELDTLITDRINNGPEFSGKKPRLVAWINNALGGAAYLPFVFPEVYFTSEGRHGGIGGIDLLHANRGDEVVREKMRSLLLARCKSLAEKGGHDARIMTAMTRGDYILSYRMVGGKPEFLEGSMPPGPEWFVVKDDGPINDENRDTMADLVRMNGNDYLTLGSQSAFDIGFSKGTADTVDDLLFKMGIDRNFAVVKNRSGDVFKEWSKDVGKCEQDIGKLIRQFQNVEVRAPAGYRERTAARTQRINILRQIQSVAREFAEALNPRRFGDADGLISDTQVVIDRIQTEQRLDRPD